MERISRKFLKGKRILNIGCGSDVFGTDFIDLYPSRSEVIKVDIDSENFPYEDGTFDVLYSNKVLEHMTNSAHFFSECRRVLKKGGLLITITDNANYLGYAIHKTHYGNYENDERSEDRHYSLFTTWHLENFAKKFGFKVKDKGFLYDETEIIEIDRRAEMSWRAKYVSGPLRKMPLEIFKKLFSVRIFLIAARE